jgi:glycosyltransferase involved in cell wall biosynthesis
MKVAVLIPCFNEEQTIAAVIRDFRKELPAADIYVYDNNSTDKTAAIAAECGATVRRESRRGKGNVIRSMFREIDADIYVMVDGDNTYPASSVHELIKPVIEGQADMVTGDRLSNQTYNRENKRRFHAFGNNLVKLFINRLFRSKLNDIMTGYRAFNRFFIKTIPVLSLGFEIETEITLHALDKRFRIREIPIVYRDRPPGSFSKLNTIRDGLRVVRTILWIFKDYRPLVFFGWWAAVFFLISVLFGTPVIIDLLRGLRAANVLIAGLAIASGLLSVIIFAIGVILDTVVKLHRLDYELTLIAYCSQNENN